MSLLAAIQTQPTASNASLARSTGCCVRTVARWSARLASGDASFHDAARSGRPRKLSGQDVQKAARHLRSARNPTMASALKLVNKDKPDEQQVSEKTLRRHLKGQSLQYKEPMRQRVSAANAAKRRKATTQAAINKMRSSLRSIIFLDGALVKWGPGKGIMPYRRGREWGDPQHPRPQNLSGTKLYHFYSAVTLGPEGQVHRHALTFVPPRKGFTAKCFVDSVAKPVLQLATDEVFHGAEFFFVQDQAKQHVAQHTKLWMQSAGYHVYEHPPQSPDMNRIEKVWTVYKDRLVGKRPKTEDGFKKTRMAEWNKVDKQAIGDIIQQLPSVMKKVHADPGKLVKM